LCRAFKIWNVDEVMKKMSSRLLTEWVAYFQLEHEERLMFELKAKAEAGEKGMRVKRGRR